MPLAMPLSTSTTPRMRLFRLPAEKAAAPRVKVSVGGRLMLEDRTEYGATTLQANVNTLILLSDARPKIEERIIGYFDTVGRLEGRVLSVSGDEIVMTIECSLRKREKIAAQLTFIANREILNLPEDRRHDRVVPRDPRVSIRKRGVENASEMRGHLIDVSRSGAGVSVSGQFEMGDEIVIGSTPARVVRVFDGGVAVEFRAPIPDAMFDIAIRL